MHFLLHHSFPHPDILASFCSFALHCSLSCNTAILSTSNLAQHLKLYKKKHWYPSVLNYSISLMSNTLILLSTQHQFAAKCKRLCALVIMAVIESKTFLLSCCLRRWWQRRRRWCAGSPQGNSFRRAAPSSRGEARRPDIAWGKCEFNISPCFALEFFSSSSLHVEFLL